jgi:hypothetical protein
MLNLTFGMVVNANSNDEDMSINSYKIEPR